MYACIRGDAEEVRQLLMNDETDVNYSNHVNTPPLEFSLSTPSILLYLHCYAYFNDAGEYSSS